MPIELDVVCLMFVVAIAVQGKATVCSGGAVYPGSFLSQAAMHAVVKKEVNATYSASYKLPKKVVWPGIPKHSKTNSAMDSPLKTLWSV